MLLVDVVVVSLLVLGVAVGLACVLGLLARELLSRVRPLDLPLPSSERPLGSVTREARKLLARAQELACQLLALDHSSRIEELASLKADNPTLHALVADELRKIKEATVAPGRSGAAVPCPTAERLSAEALSGISRLLGEIVGQASPALVPDGSRAYADHTEAMRDAMTMAMDGRHVQVLCRPDGTVLVRPSSDLDDGTVTVSPACHFPGRVLATSASEALQRMQAAGTYGRNLAHGGPVLPPTDRELLARAPQVGA